MPSSPQLLPLWLALAPVVAMLANVLLQLTLARLPLKFGHVRRQFVSFGVGALVAAAWLLFVISRTLLPNLDRCCSFALYFGTYACLGFIFFNVVNSNISSLRVRMMREYLDRDPAPLPDDELMSRYQAREMLAARLERLVQGNQIRRTESRYYPQRKLVWAIGHFFAGLRRLLLGT